jgi:hypothetical protein
MSSRAALVVGLALSASAASAATIGHGCLDCDRRVRILVTRPFSCTAAETPIVWKLHGKDTPKATTMAAFVPRSGDTRSHVSPNEMATILSVFLLIH